MVVGRDFLQQRGDPVDSVLLPMGSARARVVQLRKDFAAVVDMGLDNPDLISMAQ